MLVVVIPLLDTVIRRLLGLSGGFFLWARDIATLNVHAIMMIDHAFSVFIIKECHWSFAHPVFERRGTFLGVNLFLLIRDGTSIVVTNLSTLRAGDIIQNPLPAFLLRSGDVRLRLELLLIIRGYTLIDL